jgi:hypothetical protein
MIDQAVRDHPPEIVPAWGDPWRRMWLAVFVLVLLVTTGFLAGRRIDRGHAAAAASPSVSTSSTPAPILEATPASPTVTASPTRSPTQAPSPSASPTTELATTLLQMPGKVPTRGSGSFAYASTTGPVLGTKGPLRRFRVAVEKGSGQDVATFAAMVQATLGDKRSWTGGGTLRLQLVAGGKPSDFTVYLATRVTAGRMCLAGGTNIVIHGRPYTSCRTTGESIINLDRWMLSSTPYLAAKIPLGAYRQYVINHEVGHELGHHHVGCPKAGGPAPVMVQQTLTLRGCVPNAWPRQGSRFVTGPPV